MNNTLRSFSIRFSLTCALALPALGLPANGARAASANDADASSAPATKVIVTVSPALAAVVVTTQPQQFTATVTGNANTSVTWSVNKVVGGNSTVGTITAGGLYTPPATGGNRTITATSVAVTTASGKATVSVTALAGVFTYHNDISRDGWNPQEGALTPTTVTTATFGKLFSCPVDGAVYGQPLWVPSLSIAGGVHNVIFVATQNDSAYAFDADASPCVTYWKVNLLDTLHGGTGSETPVAWNDVGYCFGDIYPQVGVTGTPVINPKTSTMYLVSASESNPISPGNCSGSSATFYHRLHALSLTTGSEALNAPVTVSASVPGTGDGSVNGVVSFESQFEHQRAGLGFADGRVYLDFAAHEDATPYHGWVIGYKVSDVQTQAAVFNTTPNGMGGADGGIWSGGGAPAIDASGDVYIVTGNGVFDEVAPSPDSDYGDSILRLHYIAGSTTNGTHLSVAGWFTPYDQFNLAQDDTDLGAGSVVLLPKQTSGAGPTNLLTEVGKEGVIYVIDPTNMGEFNPTDNSQIWQSFTGPAHGLWGTPAFWQNSLYVGGQGDSIRQFTFNPSTELFTETAASQSSTVFRYPGTTPSVSSQWAAHGIVWAIDASLYGYAASHSAGTNCSQVPLPSACSGPAIVHAYDATNLANELWNSSQAAGGRDQAGNAVKFIPSTIANGKVYVGTTSEVDVYGLLN